jgi:integrase
MAKAWRYTVGKKGVNKVTVFERPDATSIYLMWWDDDGKHREALSTTAGHPITDREMAVELADRMSKAQERKRNQLAAEALGLAPKRKYTLGELFEQRHADLSPDWSEKYQKDRELRRKFWTDALGEGIRLTAITPAMVERIVRDAQGDKSDRWAQDVLRYMVDSFAYARRKLKAIGERDDLSGVSIPRARGVSRAYTVAEARAIVGKLSEVDPIAGWMGVIAFQTGRRIGAIRTLQPKHIEQDGARTLVRFPGDTDKARKTGVAIVYGLPERDDWTIPTQETCNAWWREAEALAGVPHEDGRAWHGVKRMYATRTSGLAAADLQAGTLRSTLDGHYRQDALEPKDEVARLLAADLGVLTRGAEG